MGEACLVRQRACARRVDLRRILSGGWRFRVGNRLLTVALAVVSMLATASWGHAEDRDGLHRWWTTDGTVVIASFVTFRGAMAVLKRANGRELSVPMFALVPDSQRQAKRLAALPPPAPPPRALPVAPSGPVIAAVQGTPASSIPRAIPVTPAVPVVRATPVVRAVPMATAPPPVATGPIVPATRDAPIAFGPSILAYCQENVGKKIGNGQCTSLAAMALKNAGAATRVGPDSPGDGDYVWGDPVAFVKVGFFGLKGVNSLKQVEPGDIVQFHGARFSGLDHGDAGVYRYEAPHHTAVVESVDPRRKTINVLQQNARGREVVSRQTLFLRGMTSGWLRVYHPVPESGSDAL